MRNQQSKGVYYFNEEAICLQDIVTAVKGDSIIALQNMQRKDPIPKHLFSDHVRNMHNNKDRDFKAEFAVGSTNWENYTNANSNLCVL